MNILLTSAGRRSYLVKYFKEAIDGKGKIFVSNSDSNSPAFNLADVSVVTPLIYDENYIPFLLDYCIENVIDVIIPLFDIDVFVLAQNKKIFADKNICVLVADWENIEFCNDKYSTFKKLKGEGLSVPMTVKNIDEAKTMIMENTLKFPLIVKPRWGMGSIGIYEADNIEELLVFYNKVKRDIQNSYLKYESSVNFEESVIIQEKINAIEYGIDVINDLEGNYQTTIVKRKNAMRAGETDSATIVNSIEIKKIGETIAKLIKHPGNLDADILYDGKDFYVLELNARFGGGYPFTHLSGVNLPKAIVKWLTNEKVTDELTENFNVSGYKDIVIKPYIEEK